MEIKAKESPQIIKAREKIQKQIQKADERTSPEAIKSKTALIQRQILRHKNERVSLKENKPANLKERTVTFDENAHSAKTKSRHVSKLMKNLQKESAAEKHQMLKGRISSFNED